MNLPVFIPDDPVADFVIKRVLLFEVCFVVLLTCVIGPMIASWHVRRQARSVFLESIKPEMAQLLDAFEARTVARIADVEERFDVLKDEARAAADEQIAAAKAQLEEQAKELEATAIANAQAEAERIIEAAKTEAGRFLGGRSAEARQLRATAAAQAQATIGAGLASRLGDVMAGRVIRWVRETMPDVWQRAVENPDQAWGILGPVVGMAEQGLSANRDYAQNGKPQKGGDGW